MRTKSRRKPTQLGLLSTALFLLAASATPSQQLAIPNGTILPVRLNQEVNSKRAQPGQVLTAKIMQDVPLASGAKISKGALVSGAVVSSVPADQGQAIVKLRFDALEIRHQKILIRTDLRALASPLEVSMAQVPETSLGFGTPWVWATTRQIGGDEVYGRYGVVTNEMNEHVGTSVMDGVLVEVREPPGSQCRGKIGDENRVQALWVFSSDACGVYGSETFLIQHAGRTDPKGLIVLLSKKGDVKVRAGSGMLLRIQR